MQKKKKHDSDYIDYKTDELMDHGISHMGKKNTLNRSRYITYKNQFHQTASSSDTTVGIQQ